jgi:hypothetical protein
MLGAALGLIRERQRTTDELQRQLTYRAPGVELRAPAMWGPGRSSAGVVLRDGPHVLVDARGEPAAGRSAVQVLEATFLVLQREAVGTGADGKDRTLVVWAERPAPAAPGQPGQERARGLLEVRPSRGMLGRPGVRLRLVAVREAERVVVLLLRDPPARLGIYAPVFEQIERSVRTLPPDPGPERDDPAR